MKNIKYNNYFFLNFIVVFFTVLSSFILEIIFDLTPCKICLYQRYIWIVLLSVLVIFCFFFNKFYLTKLIVVFFNLAILSSLAFYHSGIELGFFNNIISCSVNKGLNATSIEELDLLIRSTDNIDCAFPKFRFLGFTLANFGFFLSLALGLINLIVFKKSLSLNNAKKNRRNN